MWNSKILVLKYLPASSFLALNRVPLRMCFLQPPHQMLYGISNRIVPYFSHWLLPLDPW